MSLNVINNTIINVIKKIIFFKILVTATFLYNFVKPILLTFYRKIITKNSTVNPKRLTATGRGEFLPLDMTNTTEGRKKNRRI